MDDEPSLFARIFDLPTGGGGNRPKSPGSPKSPKGKRQEPTSPVQKEQTHAHPPEHAPSKPAANQADTPGANQAGPRDTEDGTSAFGGGPETVTKFRKIGFILLIFVITLVLACVIMLSPFIYNAFFNPETDPDANFESADASHKSRYKKIALYLLVFTLVIIASFILVMGALYILIPLFNTNLDAMLLRDGEQSLLSIYGSLLAVVVVTYIIYIIYFLFVKDYFTNLTYPTYLPEDSEKTEFMQPQKFTIFYAVMLLYIFVFVVFVMNYLEYDSPKIFFAICVILLLMMIVVGRMTKFILERNVVKSIIWSVMLYIVAPLGLLLPKLASTNMPSISFKDSKLIVKIAIISFFVILGIITYVLFTMFAKAANTDTDDGSRLI
jgi:hypothetical protein